MFDSAKFDMSKPQYYVLLVIQVMFIGWSLNKQIKVIIQELMRLMPKEMFLWITALLWFEV